MTAASPLTPAGMVEADMRRWLNRAVIGLNLCPFAKAVQVKGLIHYAVSQAREPAALLTDLRAELQALLVQDPTVRDTTLLIAPNCLSDFIEFNRLLVQARRVLRALRLQGVVQIASFHPDYRFAGTAADDITNFTNRAPYPTLHLLRESSIDRAVAAVPDAQAIFGHNMRTLEQLGLAGWHALGVGPTAAIAS